MKRVLPLLALSVGLTGVSAERPYQFRERLEIVHENGLRDAALQPAADEFVFADGVKVGDDDFADYLKVSMDVKASSESSAAVRMEIDPSLREREYEIEVGKEGVSIRAKDERARHQALYHLEDLMNLRRAPFLRFGRERRRMRFSPRMLHSGWGVDVFPDAHLKQMAHHGFDAILVFLKGEDMTQGCGEHADVNGLIERAARLGLDTYLYSKVSSFAHPADPDGAEKLRNSFGRVAKAHPKAKGIVFVGESCQFPSKDPRVQPVDYRQKNHDDPRPLAGWFPCRDYPEWLRAVKAALAEHAPDMEIVFWTYNWTRQPKEPCAEVIAAFPDGTAVQATFEKTGTAVHRNGISNVCRDYTISSVGPTDHFEAEAKAAASTHRKFYAMTNTGGLTWDYGVVPYQPCPYQWKKRWDGLVESARTCGLSGLMESHHYGWYPSFVTELAKEAFTEGGRDFESHIRAIAVRDFGERNADAVLGIWKSWSTATEDYVASNENQYGPFRIGPAFPYSIGRRYIDWSEFPQEKGATHTMRWMAYLNFPYDRKQAQLLNIGFFGVEEDFRVKQLELFELMRAAYAEGAAKLQEIAAELDPVRREKALRMAYLGEWHQRTVETAINLNRGYLAHLHGDEEGLLRYARLEYANTEAAIKLAEADSRLGFEPSMLYGAGPVQLRWKLALMREMYPGCDAR